jgi:hypothetical protein
VQEHVGAFFRGLAERTAEVQQRCRTLLQVSADALGPPATEALQHTIHEKPTLAFV